MDKDDPHTSNAMVTYRILSQKPNNSGIDLFDINPLSGMLSVKALGLDREVSIQRDLLQLPATHLSLLITDGSLLVSDSARVQADH